MSPASHTSTLFHSSFNLLDMSLIKPHLHIHTTTHIPHQPSKPKHNITHLILQFFPTSSLKHLHDFIPNLFQSQSQFTFIIPQASTIFHLSNFLLTLIRFKYFFETNSIFLVCIDFWNHILTKKMFFCFFLFCIRILMVIGQSWSSSSIVVMVSHGHRHPGPVRGRPVGGGGQSGPVLQFNVRI